MRTFKAEVAIEELPENISFIIAEFKESKPFIGLNSKHLKQKKPADLRPGTADL